MSPRITRRDFVAQFGIATWGLCALGGAGTQRALGAVLDPEDNTGALTLPLDTFPALRASGATVRVGLSPLSGSPSFRRPNNGRFYPILITHSGSNEYHAVEANCTHSSYAVERPEGADFLRCPAHGSRFTLEGRRISGPATAGLQVYETCFLPEKDAVSIALPFMNYALEISDSLAPEGRIRLRFTARFSVPYEILGKSLATGAWERLPFSLTDSGELSETVLVTDTVDRKVNIFVEPTDETTFFAVRALADIR